MKTNTKKTLSIYWERSGKQRPLFLVVLISVFFTSLIGVIIPIYYKEFFDAFLSGGNKDQIYKTLLNILLIIGVFEVIRWILWRIATFSAVHSFTRILENLYVFCFSELHKHSFSYFNNNFTGSMVKRVNWFVRAFDQIANRLIWELFPSVVSIGGIIIVVSRRNTWLGLGIVLWLIVFSIINYFFTKFKYKFDVQRNEAESKASGFLADTITNNQNVKLFTGYQIEVAGFKKLIDSVTKLRITSWSWDSIFEGVQGFFTIFLELSLIFSGVYFWKKGLLTVGDFVLLQTYVSLIIDRTWGFGRLIRSVYEGLSDAEEMTVLLNTPPEITDKKDAKKLDVRGGRIRFDKVGFKYHDGKKVVHDFNLAIKPKEKIALVGSSGSGKSTIIKLLMRMHDITEGSILVDEQGVSDVTQTSLWENVSLVPQDPILFHRSLMENIRYGRPVASDAEVFEAARLAHCHEFIDSLPEKYSTFVGERGIKLSGGERQRVAIARAILRNAPILVLDEATSSLDSESESLIQEALASLMNNKTVIVVAHRLSTIMKMDRIIVMENGKIAESGNHDELLKIEGGIYRNLWKIQAGGFLSADDEKIVLEE